MIPEWFTESVADYVDDIREDALEEEYEWLMTTNFGKVSSRDGNKITIGIDTGSFFDEDFEKFQKAAGDLSKISFDEFVAGGRVLDYAFYRLKEAYNDKFEFYVWHDDELYTMQSWMRLAKPLATYHLGGVVDYHF